MYGFSSYFFINSDDVTVLLLPRDELVDDVKQLWRGRFEVFVEVPLDCERREDVVVDESRAQIGEHARRVLDRILEQVPSDDVIQDGVAEELESGARKGEKMLEHGISLTTEHELAFKDQYYAFRPLVAVGDVVVVVRGVRERLQ